MRLLFRLLAAAAVLAAGLGALPTQAQAHPDRPIRIVAPFPAGGLVDVLARAVGEELAKTLGQPIAPTRITAPRITALHKVVAKSA
jgi:tripartite-type tricarboxylate transporter receptor subunit TctC